MKNNTPKFIQLTVDLVNIGKIEKLYLGISNPESIK